MGPTTQAMNLWADIVNEKGTSDFHHFSLTLLGGISVGNVLHQVELVTVDIGGASTAIMSSNIISTVKEMCNKTGIYGPIDIMIGPYSSTLAPVAIKESQKCNLVTILGKYYS